MRYLEGRAGCLARRIEEGWVRDGHGDLIADDVFCLDDGPRVLDCLEFDDRLRYVDVPRRRRVPRHGPRTARPPGPRPRASWTPTPSSPATPPPPSLRHHYIAYRALVRAKVAVPAPRPGRRGRAGAEARVYADLALRHLRARRRAPGPGRRLPGTGKSTLAGALADRLGWAVLRSVGVAPRNGPVTPTSSVGEAATRPHDRRGLCGARRRRPATAGDRRVGDPRRVLVGRGRTVSARERLPRRQGPTSSRSAATGASA